MSVKGLSHTMRTRFASATTDYDEKLFLKSRQRFEVSLIPLGRAGGRAGRPSLANPVRPSTDLRERNPHSHIILLATRGSRS